MEINIIKKNKKTFFNEYFNFFRDIFGTKNFILLLLICFLSIFLDAFSVALISHYQVLFDKEYMGRALSTANFFNFGGVFFVQWLTGKIIYLMGGDSSAAPIEAYRMAFLFVAILLLISLCIYLFSNEKKKSF